MLLAQITNFGFLDELMSLDFIPQLINNEK